MPQGQALAPWNDEAFSASFIFPWCFFFLLTSEALFQEYNFMEVFIVGVLEHLFVVSFMQALHRHWPFLGGIIHTYA